MVWWCEGRGWFGGGWGVSGLVVLGDWGVCIDICKNLWLGPPKNVFVSGRSLMLL